MAHVVVYMQRTPLGLHPGSIAAICLARDLADQRGATVTGLCRGDGGAYDERMVADASRAGADQVFFVGPQGFESMCRRLMPRHVFAPYSAEAKNVLDTSGIGPINPVWITDPAPNIQDLPPVVGAISGLPCWRDCPAFPEPEYEGDVGEVPMASWVASEPAPADTNLYFIGPQDLDPDARAALEEIGAQPVDANYVHEHAAGTLLWLDAGPNGLPAALGERGSAARVILLAGPTPNFHETWQLADYVLAGPWPSAIRELATPTWQGTLG